MHMRWTAYVPDEVLEDLSAVVEMASWNETLAASQQQTITRVNNAVAAELLIRGPAPAE